MAQAQDPTRVRSPVWIDAPTRISGAGPGRRRPGRVPRRLRRWPSAILDPAAPGLPCGATGRDEGTVASCGRTKELSPERSEPGKGQLSMSKRRLTRVSSYKDEHL